MAVSGSGPKAPLPELGRYVLFSHGWTWGFWSLIFLTPGVPLGPSVRADTWTFVVLVLVAIAVVAVEGTGLGRAGGVEPKPAGFDDEAPAPKVGG